MKRYLIFLLLIGCGYTETEPLDDPNDTSDTRQTESTDLCKTKICQQNANCVMSIGTPICQCNTGYIANENKCVSTTCPTTVSCPEHSSCIMQSGMPRCQCDSGYTVKDSGCIKQITESVNEPSNQCTTNTCVNKSNSHCIIMDKVPYCQCNDGYQETNKICVKIEPTPTPTPIATKYKIFPGQTKVQLVTLFGPPQFVGSYPRMYYTWGWSKNVCMTNDKVDGCTSNWGFDCDPTLWDKC